MKDLHLIEKYNIPVPRYTSYPAVPYWNKAEFNAKGWLSKLSDVFRTKEKGEGISIYIHLPFCESLCTYCGCNTRITVNHSVELIYIHGLLKEWENIRSSFHSTPVIRELHLGGGTPTFFSAENLRLLVTGILKDSVVHQADFSFEGHPNNTTEEHLKTLFELGFTRVSFGIQDFDPAVQEVINRKQSFAQVEYVTDLARMIGYSSVNFDLIYGLPLQTLESITQTIEKVIKLKPDRIAFYSYAHVPWVKPGQRKFTELDLPDNETKRNLNEKGRLLLEKAGYADIGMDHFTLPSDEFYNALKIKKLHRNFMGYTTSDSSMLIGLGCSAISDLGDAYAQNIKSVEEYLKSINEGLPTHFTGYYLTNEDIIVKKHVLNLICNYETFWNTENELCKEFTDGVIRLQEMEAEGLVEISENSIKVTEEGKPFIRNICSKLDKYFLQKMTETVFSKAV